MYTSYLLGGFNSIQVILLHHVNLLLFLFTQLELVYFPKIWLTLAEQYRWYQVVYQIGVMISRSSVNVIYFRKIWIMTVFQVNMFL